MGCSQNCACCRINSRLVFSLLFIFVSSLIQARFMVEGRAISKLTDAAAQEGKEVEKVVVMRSMIGSSPPKCERRCSSCGHCEAIQVPVTTKAQRHRSHFSAVSYYRGDDISNYKPMSWKCKCGNLIFNP